MKKQSGKQKSSNDGPISKGWTEKDADDLVHSQPYEEPLEIGEGDPDDIVHQPGLDPIKIKEDSLEDPDDLVHGQPDMNDQDL